MGRTVKERTAKPRAIVNASPLIFLAKLDRLDLLPHCLTTPIVLEEVTAGGRPEAMSIESAVAKARLVVQEPLTTPAAIGGLHAGEASILALAHDESIVDVIVDDRLAIRAAKAMGLQPVSTPFLMMHALREGRLQASEYRGLLERLLRHGYYLSPALYARLREQGD